MGYKVLRSYVGIKGDTMKIEANGAIAQLVKGYQASLEDDGDFIASEYNKLAGADIFVFDEDTDTLVLNKEALVVLPHFRVEWDIGYCGDSARTHRARAEMAFCGVNPGQFVFVPIALISVFNTPEEAFEKFTGISKTHIIHYALDEEFFLDGTGY